MKEVMAIFIIIAAALIGAGIFFYKQETPKVYKAYEGIHYCSESKMYCYKIDGKYLEETEDDGEVVMTTEKYLLSKRELKKKGIEIVSIDEDKLVLRNKSGTKTYQNLSKMPKDERDDD